MNCSNCGTLVGEGDRFCSRCGTALTAVEGASVGEGVTQPVPPAGPTVEAEGGASTEPVPPIPAAGEPPPPPPPAPPRLDPRGWWIAAVRGSLAFVIMLLLAQALAVLITIDGDVSVGDTIKAGGLSYFGFHHAGIGVALPTFDLSGLAQLAPEGAGGIPGLDDLTGLGAIDVSAGIAVALLAATALAAWLLYRGGRAAASAGGGSALARIAVGASVAVPYALLSLILALAVSFTFELPDVVPFFSPGGISVGPSAVPGFLWPFTLGVVSGGLGGLASFRKAREGEGAGRWSVGIVAGAGRMALVAAALAFVGLFVLAAANPDTFRDYFRSLGDADAVEGILQVVFTVLLVPNLMTGLTFMGMGSAVVLGDYVGGTSCGLISLSSFPQGFDTAGLERALGGDPLSAFAATSGPCGPLGLFLDSGTAPPEYFFFIIPVLAAVLLGGRHAARRGGARSYGEAAALGAGAGAAFALVLGLLAVLAGLGYRFDVSFGLRQSTIGHVGPNVLSPVWPSGVVLAALWGLVGGAVGGLLARPRPPPPTPSPPTEAYSGQGF